MYSHSYLLLCYCILATLLTVTNKHILTTFSPYSFCVLFLQSVIVLSIMKMCKSYGMITYRRFDTRYTVSWMPILLFLVLSIYSNGQSLRLIPISTFNVLKNMGLIFTFIGESFFFGRRTTIGVLPVLLVILFTTGFYGQHLFDDKEERDSLGIYWALLNCASVSSYGLYVKYYRGRYHITSIDYVYYNTLLTTPILAGLSLYFEGSNAIYYTISLMDIYFVVMLVFSSVLTLLITVVIANINKDISSTTYAIVATINKLVVSLVSVMLFQDEYRFGGIDIFVGMMSVFIGVYFVVLCT